MDGSSEADEVLERLSAQLQDLEQKKTMLLDEVAVVMLSIKRVQAEHGRVANQMARISRLPNEILTHIFMAGQQLKLRKDGSHGSGPSFEVLISHVSSYWREVCLGTPSLWTNIRNRSDASVEREIGQISAYLARSKSCPIDITFHIVDTCLYGDKLISMISAHITRWRRVFFEMQYEGDFVNVVSQIRNSAAPVLEHLSICPNNRDNSEYGKQIFSSGAPALTFVRLAGVAIRFSQPPLNAVTTLHLEDVHMEMSIQYSHFCEIIAAAPSLLNLSLYGITIESWPSAENPTIEMLTLRSLRVRGGPSMIYDLLSAVEAPLLESLIIADCADEDLVPPWTTTQFALSTPKFPKLHTLTLSDCYFTYRSCKSIFRNLPTITHFALLGSFDSDILKGLGNDGQLSSELPWAELHTLTIERLETAQETLLCTSVLTGRLQSGRPIVVLRLENSLRNKLSRRGPLKWLEQVVTVETWTSTEPWPPGLGFVDVNDLFL
jgi:hypothetical protein